jgi:hypothetical protein
VGGMETAVRVVRTRSIPNVSTERLLEDGTTLCSQVHPGSAWTDGPRRQMIDLGRKIVAIRAELTKRGVDWRCCDRYFGP